MFNILKFVSMSNSNADNNNGNNGNVDNPINVSNIFGGDMAFDGKFDPSKDYNDDTDKGEGDADKGNANKGNDGKDGQDTKKAADTTKKPADVEGKKDAGNDDKPDTEDKNKKKDEGDGGKDSAYYLDDDGNLIDAAGKIVVKKDEIKTNDKGEIILPDGVEPPKGSADELPMIDIVKNKLAADFEFDFKDENGKPLTFDDTEEGLSQLVEYAINAGLDAERDNIFHDEPRVQAYYNHLKAGGSDSAFFTREQSWKGFALPADTVVDDNANRIRKDVIVNNFLTRFNYASAAEADKPAIRARAEKFAQMTEDAGNLVSESKVSLKDLQQLEIDTDKARDDRNREILKQREARNREHYNTIATTIKTGDLKGINIPANERQAFLDYVSKPITDKRETQSMLDRKKEAIELSLQLEYMRFKGFNLDDLVSAKANTIRARTLSARRNKVAVIANGSGDRGSGTGNVPISDIKLSKLL